jgi:hypothetical protein
MKSYLSNAIAFGAIALLSANSFAQETEIPFLNNDEVSTSHFYYPNQGQIADDDGELHPEVLFHTEMTSPAYFFQNNKLSFVTLKLDSISPDTSFRLDMEFYQGTPPTINETESDINLVAQDERAGHFNYYLPHCSDGVEEVTGYERLIYKQAYQDIDAEFTSNVSGLKARFVVHAGADPDDILLKFTGQNSIIEQTNGDLEIYLGSWKMEFKQAYAYQVENGEASLVNWLPIWVHDGNGIVSITTGAYDTSLPLIIEIGGPGQAAPQGSVTPPHWGTYYGGMGIDQNKDFDTDLDGNFYTLTNVKGSGATFPALSGVSYPNNLSFNVLVSKFYPNESRVFATYYGGTQDDQGMALEYQIVPDSPGNVFIGGYTTSDNLQYGQSTSTFNQSRQQGIDGLLLKFNASLGTRLWATYFGGNGSEFIMDVVAYHKKLYLCGVTSSTNAGDCTGSANGIPMCNSSGSSFYQTSNQGNRDGFIAELNIDPLAQISLAWSTYFGGAQNDRAYAIEMKRDPVTNTSEIYVAGMTNTSQTESNISSPTSANTSGSFPLANPQNGAYFQSNFGASSSPTGTDGFIAKFDTLRQLVWSSFYGGDESDNFGDIAISANGITVVGYTESSTSSSGQCATNSNGYIPKCSTSPSGYLASNKGLRDILITQFSLNGVLNWSTCYGGVDQEAALGLVNCVTDLEDNIYITSNSLYKNAAATNMSTLNPGGVYYQNDNQHITDGGQGTDNFLLMFNDNNSRIWATYFGGGCGGCSDTMGNEYAEALTVFNSEWIYFGGYTHSLTTPRRKPWNGAYFDDQQGSIGNSYREEDGYIAKVNVYNLAMFLTELTDNGSLEYLKGYPNPAINEVNIIMPFSSSESANVIIYNNLGQEVKRFTTFTQDGKLTLDITSINSGMYFMKIETNKNTKNYVYSFIK